MPTIPANDITLAYEIQSEGHPLLLISGVGYGAWFWHSLVPRLSKEFRVITFDNRGAGASDKPAGPYSTALMAADTIGLLDGLGIRSAFVMGHSLGGFIAQEVTLASPTLVKKLILAATTFGGPNVIPITPEALEVFMNRNGDPQDLFRRGLAVSTAHQFRQRYPQALAELFTYRMTIPVPPVQFAAQVMAGTAHNAEARIGQIQCPTLILFGAEDRVVPPGNANLLAQKIRGAQTKILPNLGHLFPIEDPEATVKAIIGFISMD